MLRHLNLYHYSPCKLAGENTLYFSTPALYLNAYLKTYREDLHSLVSWKKLQFHSLNSEQIIRELKELEINVLCVSLYVWNKREIFSVLGDIKREIPDIHIIAGGPSTDVINDKEFLDKHPYIDYAVYAQGEQAFAHVLDHITGKKKLSLLYSKNVSWRDNGKNKLADFEFVKFNNLSPYLLSSDIIEQTVSDPDFSGYKFSFPYETSRGCPYNCTFCDWTSGLTHKTYYRKFDIEGELDLLGRLGIHSIHISDANFGQVERDLDIAKTMVRLKREKGYDFKIQKNNFSKLQKDRAFEIIDILMEGDVFNGIQFAVQDTHDIVLENVERPDVPWPKHKQYIINLAKKYPTADIQLELIQGLPGQTRQIWEENLIELYPFAPRIYNWTILPNSPAGYDKEYQQRMKLSTSLSDIGSHDFRKVELVTSTYSYDVTDYAYFTLLTRLCMSDGFFKVPNLDLRALFDKIAKSKHLDQALTRIKQLLDGGTARDLPGIIDDFIKAFMLEFYKELPKEVKAQFVRMVTS